LHESRIKEIHKQYKEEKEDEKEILEVNSQGIFKRHIQDIQHGRLL